MVRELTKGSVVKSMLAFSLPMIAGNLLQQLYNVVDTLIVGRALGRQALAAVGSSSALMVFLVSATLGFCMGGGVVFSRLFGAGRMEELKTCLVNAFGFIAAVTLAVNLTAWLALDPLLRLLNVQPEAMAQTKAYLRVVLPGMVFVFLFNFFAAALRSVGNSTAPLVFLAVASLLNIGLDLLFVLAFGWGVTGAAAATVTAQGLSAILAGWFFVSKAPALRPRKRNMHIDTTLLRAVVGSSVLTGLQQSLMNFGILLVQGLVNSFGVVAMAAFAAAVKIDSFAYMPAQDFGNAFSTFAAQNYGAGKTERVKKGCRAAVCVSAIFCVAVSVLVFLFAQPLMLLFVQPSETAVLATGIEYLRIEGAFYPLIGLLFLLYGYFRAVGRPGISLVLTVASLGIRVVLAYMLAPLTGLAGIWWAIPAGWLLADFIGLLLYRRHSKHNT